MILPELPELDENTIRIVGIDPGSTKLGFGVIDVDLITLTPTVVYATTLNATQDSGRALSNETLTLGTRAERLSYLTRHLQRLLVCVEPHVVSSEMFFLKRARVGAYEALVECLDMIRKTVWRYSPGLTLRTFDPVRVKSSVGVSHIKTDKNDVTVGLVKTLGENFHSDFTLLGLDEHAVDAVCVANTCYRTLILKETLVGKKKRKPKTKSSTTPKPRRKRRARK